MSKDKIRVAIYARLSREDGDDKESESIENQKAQLVRFINDKSNWELINIYFDDGYTGLNFERPDFKRIKNDIIDDKIDVIICTKQSRIGRDSSGVDDFLFGFLIEHQVRCIGILDGLDNFNRSNKKSAQITGLTNEWYSEEISYSVKSAFDVKRGRGEFIGSLAPYGYKKHPNNKNQLIIDEEIAPVIKDIYKWYIEGLGYVKITQYLNEKKIITPSEHSQVFNYNKNKVKKMSWSYHTVRRILMNEVYIGNLVQKKSKTINFKTGKRISTHKSEIIKVENTHEAIIGKETFELVQSMMSKRTRARPLEGKKNLFSGLMICGDCGRNMTYRADNNIFYCTSFKLYDGICSKHKIKVEDLEKLVFNDIKKIIDDNNEIIRNESESVYKSQSKNKNNKNILLVQLSKIQKRLEKINLTKKELYEDYKSEILTKDEFLQFKNNYTIEENKLNENIKTINDELKIISEVKNSNDEWRKIYQKYYNITKLNHEIINKFVEYIEIFEDENGKIYPEISYNEGVNIFDLQDNNLNVLI